MIPTFKFIFLIVSFFVIGDVVLRLGLRMKFYKNITARVSLAYGVGVGTLTLLIFYISYLGGTLRFRNIVLLSSVFLLIFLYDILKNFRFSGLTNNAQAYGLLPRGLRFFFLVVIITVMSMIIFRALFLPMHLPDDRAQWGLKGKIFYYESTVYAPDFYEREPFRLIYHASYPPLIPLVESFFYSACGNMNDYLVKTPFPLFFGALLLFFYYAQRYYASRLHSLMFTTVMVLLPSFISDCESNPSSGYADIAETFYYFAAAAFVFFWIQERKKENLLLSAILITFAVFTKQEGIFLWGGMLGGGLFTLFMIDKKFTKDTVHFLLCFVGLPTLLLLPWFHYNRLFEIPVFERNFQLSFFSWTYLQGQLFRIPLIMQAFFNTCFSPLRKGILCSLFLISIMLFLKKSFSFTRLFFLILIAYNLIALFTATLVYPHTWWTHFLHYMYRHLMINIPLVLYFMSCQLHHSRLCLSRY